MSAACASPASSGGAHDALRRRMRIDTNTVYERQHDERSLLSTASEDILGASPNSFVLVNADDFLDFSASDRAFSTDIDMNDWQLMSSPHSPYRNPGSVSGEPSSHGHLDSAQRIPRNFSLASSSISSAPHSNGQMLSPYTSSPEDQYNPIPFFSVATNQPSTMAQENYPDLQFTFVTQSQHQQTNVTTAPASNTLRVPHRTHPSFSPQTALGASSQALPMHDPWSVPRASYSHDTAAPIFGFGYQMGQQFPRYPQDTSTGLATTEHSLSPGARDSPTNQEPTWPLSGGLGYAGDTSFNQHTLLAFGAGIDMPQPDSFPHSLASSDIAPSSAQPPEAGDDIGAVPGHQPPTLPPTVPPSQDDQVSISGRSRSYRFEPYAPSGSMQPQPLPPTGPRRTSAASRRMGGRMLGTKFDAAKAEKIKERREDGACWVCSLQRDECSGGAVCQRCERRAGRPNADVSLACDRTKLQDLKEIFVPRILTKMYEKENVENFARAHIGRWHKKRIIVPCKLIFGFEPIDVEMYEFVPRDDIIRHSVLTREDHSTNTSDIEKLRSPPLGLEMIDRQDLHKYNAEIDDIVNNWLHIFVGRFYGRSEDEFAPRLLQLMAEFCRSPAEEAKFLRDVFRLLVVTHYLSHHISIAESAREAVFANLSSYAPGTYPRHCGPKLANRQLKHLFSSIRDTLTDRVLKQLSQFLKSSNRHARWTAAFCAILGLAVAHEQSQQLIHIILATEVDEGSITPDEARRQGERACAVIDERFDFVTKLFRIKYHAKFNPLRDRMKPGVRETLGERAFAFVDAVAALARSKGEFLRDRARERIAADNQLKYTARLQASFLLSFWPPS